MARLYKVILEGSDLRQHWAMGSRIKNGGVSYRVGRMSYGDYFLEPGEPAAETKPFNNGTIWLHHVIGKKDMYMGVYKMGSYNRGGKNKGGKIK